MLECTKLISQKTGPDAAIERRDGSGKKDESPKKTELKTDTNQKPAPTFDCGFGFGFGSTGTEADEWRVDPRVRLTSV